MNEQEKYIKTFEEQCEGGFDVPDNFFEKSKQQLLFKTNKGGFSIPDQYFEVSKTNLLNQVNKPHRKIALTYWKFAAAAVLMLSLSLYWYLPMAVSPQSADLNEDEIINYLVSTGVEDYNIALIQPNEPVAKNDHEEELIYQIEEDLIINEL
jgi:hypothetical protein